MAEPKNSFDFGTGSIDKDQWLRDIDNGQDAFISRYSEAVNKHRATLLRDAFTDLRRRIANGDMLNRTADGLYQFGSALNREDKHMEEAYRRALGFMGDLARKQIQAPPPEPEKKKYSTKTLNDRFVRYFNPSGSQESFTSLWNSYDKTTRLNNIKKFLQDELTTGLSNYLDVEDYESLDKLKTAINDFVTDPNITNLNRLGFTKNYLELLTSESLEEEEKPKSEEELLLLELLQRLQSAKNEATREYLMLLNNKKDAGFNFTTNPYTNYGSAFLDWLHNKIYTKKDGKWYVKAGVYYNTPDGKPHTLTKDIPYNGDIVEDINKFYYDVYRKLYNIDLDSYFKDLGTKYESLYNKGKNELASNLAKLFATHNGGNVGDWLKYFTDIGSGRYLINGSEDEYGNYAYYIPGEGILRRNKSEADDTTKQALSNWAAFHKEGGIIKFQNGGYNHLEFLEYGLHKKDELKTSLPEQKLKQNNQLNTAEQQMDAGDWITMLSTTAADIGSMVSANAVGAGTAVSAGLGVASTLGNSVNDFRHGNVGSGLANLGIGLTTDLVGLVPGFGAGAKGYKIGRTLTRFARPLMAAFTANNFKEAGEVLGKGVRNGFGSLTGLDWIVLGYALTSMVSRGKSAHTRLKNVEFMSKASQHSSPTDAKGNITKHIINEEGFIKARKELLDLKKFGYNTASRKYTKNVWNSIPEGEEIPTPFYAKPFEWPKFGFGKNKKLKLVEEFEEFLKESKKPEASPLGSGPDAPVVVPNENANGFYPLIKNGAKLKALRNGGIIKAVKGVKLSSNAGSWYNDVFSGYGDTIISKLKSLQGDDRLKAVDWLNGMQDQHSLMYTRAGNNFNATASGDVITHAYQVAYNHGNGFTTEPGGFNTLGIKPNYNSRYDFEGVERNTGDNAGQNWGPDGYYSLITDDRRILGRLDDWDPEKLNTFNERLKELGYTMDNNYDDKYYRIKPLKETSSPTNPNDAILQDMASKSGSKDEAKEIKDSLGGDKTIFNTNFENPIDPTPFIVAGKTMTGLMGNKNVYGNLIDEMPQAPLRDPINRQLAIVGWQERIKNGQNQLADLRRIQQMQQGSDQQTNFATALETDRTGRDIMDKAFQEDSGRQFETAQKLWNLKNEDIMYNTGVSDANRRAIADRARMIAQIRAAWRSGNNNILMGALSDTGNWLLKKYQREQDIIDLAREQQLGTKELFIEDYIKLKNPNYEALKAEYETTKDENRKKLIATLILEMKLEALRTAPSAWALKIYSNFHTPGFGGGYKETVVPLSKDGSKLEIAKLKARSKDNDRYVSMIKDLRTTRSRRRRR